MHTLLHALSNKCPPNQTDSLGSGVIPSDFISVPITNRKQHLRRHRCCVSDTEIHTSHQHKLTHTSTQFWKYGPPRHSIRTCDVWIWHNRALLYLPFFLPEYSAQISYVAAPCTSHEKFTRMHEPRTHRIPTAVHFRAAAHLHCAVANQSMNTIRHTVDATHRGRETRERHTQTHTHTPKYTHPIDHAESRDAFSCCSCTLGALNVWMFRVMLCGRLCLCRGFCGRTRKIALYAQVGFSRCQKCMRKSRRIEVMAT